MRRYARNHDLPADHAKDSRVIKEIIDDVARSKVKFTYGKPVETLAIDSVSVLWGVQQEMAYGSAEARVIKKGFKAENSNATQLDWALVK